MLAELVADHPYLIAQASSPHDLAQAAYGLPGPSPSFRAKSILKY